MWNNNEENVKKQMSIKSFVTQKIMGLIMKNVMQYDSFLWNSLGNYWGIIVHHPTRAPDVSSGSHLIGWQSLEGHVLTSPISLSSSMNKAFSDYIKQGLFNRSQLAAPREQRAAAGKRSGCRMRGWSCNHTHNFTPLPLHGSWIEPLDLTADWTKMDNEEWEERGEKE